MMFGTPSNPVDELREFLQRQHTQATRAGTYARHAQAVIRRRMAVLRASQHTARRRAVHVQ
jgi:hypothetical protein